MNDMATRQLFLWLDRGFWLIWLGFPALVWLIIDGIMGIPVQLAEMVPEQAACIAKLPQVMNFSLTGRTVFWSVFAVEMAFYVVLLVMAHRVIHHCAMGRVFMVGMIGMLRAIGMTIAVFPVLDLALGNLSMAAYVATGDLLVFLPNFALDLPVIGVGLLMVTMAAAMRLAARLHRDAALTI
jgi:hypothetical protein